MTPRFTSAGVRGGIWQGVLQADPRPDRVALALHGQIVAAAELTPQDAGVWRVEVALPASTLATGVQTYTLIADNGTGTEGPQPGAVRLGQLPLLAGDPLDDDLRAEIDLLRSEIDLLKREFRRLATE